MHEIGIMQSALALVREQAEKYGAERVTKVVYRVGSLAGVDLNSLRFAFDALVKGTIVQGATLEIEAVPARVRCQACESEFSVEKGTAFQCPRCAAYSADIRAGRELGIARLEFEHAHGDLPPVKPVAKDAHSNFVR